jgi:multiple sugar transport system permease protein
MKETTLRGRVAPATRTQSSSTYRAELRLLLLPFLLGSAVLVAAPALLSLGLAFAKYDAVSPPTWYGLRNFSNLAADPRFWISIQNSLYFIIAAVPLRVLGALALALLLHQRAPGVGFYRTAVYLPTLIPDVAYALVWLWIFNPLYGPLNLILGALGLPTPAWLVNPQTAKPALVLMSLFQIGEGFVVLLAGLHHIPKDYYDAAVVDGGSRWQVFYYVTLPLLIPWLALLTFRDVILSFQNTFTPAFLMTGGDPYYATLFVPLLIYEEAFDSLRFGQSAALMLLMFLLTLLIVFALFVLFRRWGYADEV